MMQPPLHPCQPLAAEVEGWSRVRHMESTAAQAPWLGGNKVSRNMEGEKWQENDWDRGRLDGIQRRILTKILVKLLMFF